MAAFWIPTRTKNRGPLALVSTTHCREQPSAKLHVGVRTQDTVTGVAHSTWDALPSASTAAGSDALEVRQGLPVSTTDRMTGDSYTKSRELVAGAPPTFTDMMYLRPPAHPINQTLVTLIANRAGDDHAGSHDAAALGDSAVL